MLLHEKSSFMNNDDNFNFSEDVKIDFFKSNKLIIYIGI